MDPLPVTAYASAGGSQVAEPTGSAIHDAGKLWLERGDMRDRRMENALARARRDCNASRETDIARQAIPSMTIAVVEDLEVTTADLLTAWREATRAAELAERLARMALEAADQADARAVASEEIAALARQAAESATRAAEVATAAAAQDAESARLARIEHVRDAEDAAEGALAEEEAKRQYHEAEEEARHRTGRNGTG
jgi:hypothetical protein